MNLTLSAVPYKDLHCLFTMLLLLKEQAFIVFVIKAGKHPTDIYGTMLLNIILMYNVDPN